MATTNFFTIRERVQDRLYGSRAAMLRGTNDSGSTTTIVDAAIALPGSTADHYDYGYVKIRSDTAGAAPQGEVRTITEGGWGASTGTITVSAFTAATAVGDTYEIWPDQHPDFVDRLINRKLRELHMPSLFPLSMDLVTSDNNDFEQLVSDPTVTGWTENGGAAVTAATETSRIYNGARSLTLIHGTAATGYYDRQFNVVSGNSYYTSIMAAADAGNTAIFVLRDATNSVAIDDARTTQQVMQELIIPWTAPSTCRRAQVRLTGGANSDVTYWDDYQTWFNGDGIYPLPSWITRKEQLISIVAFPPGRAGPASDFDYITDERNSRKLSYRFERADTRATNELFVFVQGCSNWRPYIVAYRPLDEVTADYVSTTANTVPLSSTEADALVLGVMAELHRMKANETVGETRAQHIREAQRYEREWDAGTRHLRPEWRETTRQHDRVYGTVA